MKRALLAGAAVLWFLVVFLVTFRWTFPSDAVADRLQFEILEATDGAWMLDVRDVEPWWAGASARDVRLFQADPRRPEEDPTLAFAAESARIRVSVPSLMRQAPTVSGAVVVGSGTVDFVVGSRMNERGTELGLGEIDLTAKAFPLAELAALAGASMDGRGTLDIDVKLDAPESMSAAVGSATISGRSLMISNLNLSDMGVPDLGLEIPIDDLDLHVEIADGKAQIVRGLLRSDLATVELDGEITLRDDLQRSTLNVGIQVGSLGPAVQMFKGFLGQEWADGKFHYRCTGTLQRNNCRAERERGARGAAANNTGPRGRNLPNARPNQDMPAARGARPVVDAEERERRKEELRERLRNRRGEGAPPVGLPHRTPAGDEGEEYLVEDYEDDEEDLLDDEYLPHDEEEEYADDDF